jgi:hypothetical protein
MVVGLALLLVAGLLAAWAGSSGSDVSTTVITSNGQTITVRTVEALPGKNYTTTIARARTITVNRGGATRSVRVPVGAPEVKTVSSPPRTVTGPTRLVPGATHTVTKTVPGPARTVTHATTVNHVETRVETRTIAQQVPGPATTVVATQTVTVQGGGPSCPKPPGNPHCP